MNTRAFLIGGLLTAVLLISCSSSYSNEWVRYVRSNSISDTLFDNLYVYNNCLYGILDDTYVTLDTEANN